MNKRILAGIILIASCTQSSHSVEVELPPCVGIPRNISPREIQAFIKKDICTACLDLFIARLHTEKKKTIIEFIIQDPDIFHTWTYRYGNQDRIVLMNENMIRCIDTTLDFSTVFHYDERGNVLWKSALDVENIPWILERLPQD
jgi:hypothetical protein